MMENKLKLLIQNEESISDFVKDLIKEEAELINNETGINEGRVELRTSYILEHDEKIEASFFIINNISHTINYENVTFCLVKDNINICLQQFDGKQLGDIPAKSMKYVTVVFNKNLNHSYDLEDSKVSFKADTLEIKFTVESRIDNLPISIIKKDSKVINKFIDELPYLAVNVIDINTFSVVYDEDYNLLIIMVIRNGYSSGVKLGALPIKVFDAFNKLVYEGTVVFENLQINPRTANLQSIVVNKEKLLIKDADLSKYNVELK